MSRITRNKIKTYRKPFPKVVCHEVWLTHPEADQAYDHRLYKVVTAHEARRLAAAFHDTRLRNTASSAKIEIVKVVKTRTRIPFRPKP